MADFCFIKRFQRNAVEKIRGNHVMSEVVTQQNAGEWYRIVSDWPNFWGNYDKNFRGLLAQAGWINSKHPELRAEYEEAIRKGAELYARLAKIDLSINSIKSGWHTFKSMVGLAGLGILPAIPVAVSVAAAVSAIAAATYLLKNFAELGARYSLIQQGEASGLSPADASKRADSIVGAPGTSGTIFGFPVKWLVIGAIALMALPVILPMLRKGK